MQILKNTRLSNCRIFNLVAVAFAALLCTSSASSVFAVTLNVPSPQYPTIQSAVNAANSGDTIILQAGVAFTESVELKYKPGNDYITIQSSALSNLPPNGKRVSPL